MERRIGVRILIWGGCRKSCPVLKISSQFPEKTCPVLKIFPSSSQKILVQFSKSGSCHLTSSQAPYTSQFYMSTAARTYIENGLFLYIYSIHYKPSVRLYKRLYAYHIGCIGYICKQLSYVHTVAYTLPICVRLDFI